MFQAHECTTLLKTILYLLPERLLQNYRKTLQSDSEVIINWFRKNKIIVNPGKFQAIIVNKERHDYSNETIEFENETFDTIYSVKLLGIQLDDKLDFSFHVRNICKSVAN